MTNEERARKLANDPRFENALAALKEAVGASDDDPFSPGIMAISLATSVFVAFASILEVRELAKMEESLNVLIQVIEMMAKQFREQKRLAGILGE